MKKLFAIALCVASFAAQAQNIHLGWLESSPAAMEMSKMTIGGGDGVKMEFQQVTRSGRPILNCRYRVTPEGRKFLAQQAGGNRDILKAGYFEYRSDNSSIATQPGWPHECPMNLYWDLNKK